MAEVQIIQKVNGRIDRNKGTIILNLNVGGDFSPNSNFLYYNFYKWYRQQ